MRCDTASGVVKRRAVSQPNQRKELIEFAVRVNGEPFASQILERMRLLYDDWCECDAHGIQDVTPDGWSVRLRTSRRGLAGVPLTERHDSLSLDGVRAKTQLERYPSISDGNFSPADGVVKRDRSRLIPFFATK